ncbi:hypothetical protein GCM10022200_23930 [Microbacterium awajiense]|uniref:SnoaL-like domain-containing protein n=1 Tax=Microbacterium awajiense TaxID=415214 RepID=A0ABP7ASJ5_9MICO
MATETTTIEATLARWKGAVEARDAGAAASCLAEDARFRSATTDAYEYTSRTDIERMEEVMFALFDAVHVDEAIGTGDTRAVRLTILMRGEVVDELKVLRFGADGLIREITAYVRPLPALASIPALAGPALARANGNPWVAGMIAASARPIAAALRSGDRSMAPMTDPARRVSVR